MCLQLPLITARVISHVRNGMIDYLLSAGIILVVSLLLCAAFFFLLYFIRKQEWNKYRLEIAENQVLIGARPEDYLNVIFFDDEFRIQQFRTKKLY